MKTRVRIDKVDPMGRESSRDGATIGPGGGITSDWWNQWTRLNPLSEALFNGQVDLKTAEPAPPGAIEAKRSPQTCPACGSIIYSRRHLLCGVCAHPLPPEARFPDGEASRIELLVEMERDRHRQWLAHVSD
jgi:hypothetical protein